MPVTCLAQRLTLGATLTVAIDSLLCRGADIHGAQHPAKLGGVHFTLGFPGRTCGEGSTCSLSGLQLVGPLLSWPEGGSPTLPSFSFPSSPWAEPGPGHPPPSQAPVPGRGTVPLGDPSLCFLHFLVFQGA